MHRYLRAIGFSDPQNGKLIHNLIEQTIGKPSYRAYTSAAGDSDVMTAEYQLELGKGLAFMVVGQYDGEGEFFREYYMPLLRREYDSTSEDVAVEERMETESYAGICDDLRVGVSLIFRLQNVVDYAKRRNAELLPVAGTRVAFSGLCTDGMIMLPILKSETDRRFQRTVEENKEKLLHRARFGDEKAIKDLTAHDMDTYSVLMDQLPDSDVYTLVDSSFMPVGVECDLYSVLGEIHRCELVQNRISGEEVWVLTIDCNELYFDVAINRKDLYGEPAVGRRFKGTIWLQGRIIFPDEFGPAL